MTSSSSPLSPQIFFEGGARVGVDRGGLRAIRARDLAIRFAFGFGVSVVAGLVTVIFGARAGGLFLAFPAILPASITLIAKKEGRRQAEGNAVGAIIGALALGAFASTAFALLTRVSAVVAEVTAFAAWVGTALVLYAVTRRALR